MTLSDNGVDEARAQLEALLDSFCWSVSFADRESVQWIPPVADRITHHARPFLVPSVDWSASEPHVFEMTGFDAEIDVATNVQDLKAWLMRQALDERMRGRNAIVAAQGRRRRARRVVPGDAASAGVGRYSQI
jgi:hypothetical protein